MSKKWMRFFKPRIDTGLPGFYGLPFWRQVSFASSVLNSLFLDPVVATALGRRVAVPRRYDFLRLFSHRNRRA